MFKYDFFVAGRWRNYEAVRQVLETIRSTGKTAYCFIDNPYAGEKVSFEQLDAIEETMQRLESLSLDDPHVKNIFEADMSAERDSKNFLLVLPAGISAHIKAGVAYGTGKPCYAVGQPDKTETLYSIFSQIFPNVDALKEWL